MCLPLTLACLPKAEAHIDIEDPDVPLFESIDKASAIIGKAEEYQKAGDKVLLTVGPRCIDGWKDYAKDYPGFKTELFALAKKSKASVDQLGKDMKEGSGELTAAIVCGPQGKEIGEQIKQNLVTADKYEAILAQEEKDVDDLQSRALKRFKFEAGDHYKRALSCMFKRYYDDVVTIAFEEIDDSSNQLSSGFYMTRDTLDRLRDRLSAEKEELKKSGVAYEAFKTSCAPKAVKQAAEEEAAPEGHGDAGTLEAK
ncbi:MAG: hypothetical protein ACXVCI_13875 [Bdellovibrionota bacterium]